MKSVKSSKLSLRKMTVIGVLGAISIILGLTPLGFIPIGPTKATIMHIPVIIGSILEGPIVGMNIGLIFGLFSMFQAFTNPTPVSFVFYNPIVALLPRVLMGYLSYYIYKFFESKKSLTIKLILNLVLAGFLIYLGNTIYGLIINSGSIFLMFMNLIFLFIIMFLIYYINKLDKGVIELTISAGLGTLINTVGVLSSIYFLYGERYVSTLGKSKELARSIIFGIAITNGIPEVILAIIITVSVVGALKNRR